MARRKMQQGPAAARRALLAPITAAALRLWLLQRNACIVGYAGTRFALQATAPRAAAHGRRPGGARQRAAGGGAAAGGRTVEVPVTGARA